jgi:hypothetical protein
MPLLPQNLDCCTDELRDVLEQIANVLNKNVVVDGEDGDWVNFRVIGLTDWGAAEEIEENKEEIFGADHVYYPIRCSFKSPRGEGVWIYDGDASHEYRHGFWYY